MLKYLPENQIGIFYFEGVIIYSRIESKNNNQLKFIAKLANDVKLRKQSKLAVIYGRHLVEEAIRADILQQIYILDTAIESFCEILENNQDINKKVTVLDRNLIGKINVLDSMIDCVAIIHANYQNLNAQVVDNDSSYLILENIQDPGNLGTIMRAAVASGVPNLILSSNSVDIYNPKVLRASQGIQFSLNVICDVEILEFLSLYNGQILAMLPDTTTSFYDYDLTIPTAFILGNEGNGLSNTLKNMVQNHVSIPMSGHAESLNLAMAASIAVFEMSRQRLTK